VLWIHTIFAVLSAWWVVFIIIAAIRKQKPVFLFLLILFLVWGISEIILMMSSPPIAAILFIVPFLILIQMMRVVQEYQRGVLFRFGRLQKVMEPGFNLILPFGIDSLRKVDMRTYTIDVPKQEVITRDNVPVIVDAVVYFNVFDSMLAVVKIADYTKGTSLLAQTILRSVLGQHELDEMLTQRAQLGQVLQGLLDDATNPWGIRVSAVEIKAIELAETMKRAMARQAEAERERRAKIIAAEGELQASEKLAQAADVLAKSPASLQLRYLQTLSEIAVEKNSTIVFPLPMDLLNVISKVAEKSSE
jgi:regulator of protease activity HflC (stomatin/prohibitin superfamily)